MGLFDAMKRALRVAPLPGDGPHPTLVKAELSRFELAATRGDEKGCLEAAFELLQLGRHDDALAAFRRMLELFPRGAPEWHRWIGQTLYISISWRAGSESERLKLWSEALAHYFRAAEGGDRTQEQNVVELLENLGSAPSLAKPERLALFAKYRQLFPDGAMREQVERLQGDAELS